MDTRYRIILSVLIFLLCTTAKGQEIKLSLSLEEVIAEAQDNSLQAMMAKHNFRASYWEYRSYQAKLLPSLNLHGTLGNYNRSLVDLQDPQTGEINYISNHNMRNNLSLSIDQNIAATGGTLSLYTNLYRIDEYAPDRNTFYNSQPINITYIQPVKGYNWLRWEKKISPQEYEHAKRSYLEMMENITVTAVHYYFNLLLAQQRLEMAQKNYENTEVMYKIAEERFSKTGSVTRSDLLQLELRLLNDGLSINDYQLALDRAMFSLRSFLGYNDQVEIELSWPDEIPQLTLDYREVLNHTYENSSFGLKQELQILRAEESVAQAKANRGIDLTFRAQFGLTQQGEGLSEAYRNPMDQEIVSLGLNLPIIDWGLGKGRVKMAQSREDVVRTQVEQAYIDHRQEVMMNVFEFNNQRHQCEIAAKADRVAQERYEITLERFANGSIGVIELNLAQSEKDAAVTRYINELSNYWVSYYSIRKQSLYDYITEKNITTQFEEIIDN